MRTSPLTPRPPVPSQSRPYASTNQCPDYCPPISAGAAPPWESRRPQRPHHARTETWQRREAGREEGRAGGRAGLMTVPCTEAVASNVPCELNARHPSAALCACQPCPPLLRTARPLTTANEQARHSQKPAGLSHLSRAMGRLLLSSTRHGDCFGAPTHSPVAAAGAGAGGRCTLP